MWRTNLRLAFRSLNRYRTTAVINILGLSVGLLAYLLILQHLSYEWSFDRFHHHADNIYRVDSEFDSGSERLRYAANYYGVAEAMKEDLPEVEEYCTLHFTEMLINANDELHAQEDVFLVDPSFASFFSFPLIAGQLQDALAEPGSAILSQKAAERYFGKENPVGKTLRYNDDQLLDIKAVVEVPANSHFQFSIVTNGEENISGYRADDGIWNWSNFYVYVRLQKGADPSVTEAKLPALFAKYLPDDTEKTASYLVPMTDIHLKSHVFDELGMNGSSQVMFILLAVALAILLIGWINYINLATAQAAEHSQEVGVRKVIGARRGQLIWQFFTQSIVVTIFSLVLALLVVALGKPYFEHLLGHPVNTQYFRLQHYLQFGGFFLSGMLVSGLYPAALISGLQTQNALKGRLTNYLSGLWMRRGLTIFQFVASILLIAGTFAIYQQVSYMQSQELGFSSEQVLVVNGPRYNRDEYPNAFQPFRESLQQFPEIASFSATTTIPSKGYSASLSGVRRAGISQEKGLLLDFILVDHEFLSTYDIGLTAGRNFQVGRDSSHRAVLLNEKAAQRLGFQDPTAAIGKEILWSSTDTPRSRRKIVGVIPDYHHRSLQAEQSPMVILYDDFPKDYYSIRLQNTKDVSSTIAKVKAAYEQIFPNNPFNHFFLDDAFQAQYVAELRLGKIMTLFGGLAIFIACLGLFGLASFNALRRMKEMGIRKVLGASLANIVILFTQDFAWLIVSANLIGLPLAYWLINRWLHNYAYSMPIRPVLFLVPAFLLVLVSVVTISYHTFRTAFTNPVEHLRQE